MRRLRQVTGDGAGPAQRALASLGAARRAHDAGDPATAVRLSGEAVTRLRALVGSGARVAEPSLCRALLDQSGYLQERSAYDEAVAAAEEAVTLARAEPGRAPMLVVALTALAVRLVGAGRVADGAEAAREALTIGDVRPDPEPARLATGLAGALGRAGWHDEALVQSERAVGMWRALGGGAGYPLGQAFSDHAGLLYSAGRWADAIEYSAEAVAYWGGRPAEQPDRLALALTNHAIMLGRVGRDEEALAAAAAAEALRG
ncbi:hypothetical protein L3i22_018650 [Actinoplanes sp. L3-i22]|nr:hypothetical protein L3i22_018650 [Actinoplanes sp. L3-i22]